MFGRCLRRIFISFYVFVFFFVVIEVVFGCVGDMVDIFRDVGFK